MTASAFNIGYFVYRPVCTCQLDLNLTNSLDYNSLFSAEYTQFQFLEIIFNNLQGIWWNTPVFF